MNLAHLLLYSSLLKFKMSNGTFWIYRKALQEVFVIPVYIFCVNEIFIFICIHGQECAAPIYLT
jgi:hypothetical protein